MYLVPTYMFFKSTTTMYTVNGYRELQMDTGILYSFCGEAKNVTVKP